MANFYGELVIRITSDTAGLKKGLNESAAATTAMGQKVGSSSRLAAQRMEHVGRQMQNIGRQMTQFVTLPVAAGFAVAGIAAYKYEQNLLKIRNLTGLTAAETKKYGDAMLDLGKQTGSTPLKLSEAFYFLASSGFKGKEAMDALKVSAEASAAGLGDVMATADVVSSAVNAYGHSNLTAAHMVDVLMKTIEVGKAEPEALAASLGRIMPVAQGLGVNIEDLGGMIAGLTLTGLSSAEAVTSLRGTMMALSAPTKMSQAAYKDMGLTYKEVSDSIRKNGLIETLQSLYERVDGDRLKMRMLIPNVRALNGVLSLLGPNYQKNLEVIDQVNNAQGKLNETMKATRETNVFKLKSAWASLQASFIKIGATLLPVFVQIAQWAERLVEKFNGMSDGWRNFLLKLAATAAIIGPVVMVLGTFINALGLIRGAMVGMKSIQALGAIFAAFKVGGAAAAVSTFAASLGPLAIALGALAAAGAAVYGIVKLRDWLDGTTDRIGTMRTAAEAMASDNSIKEWADRNFGGHLVAKGKNDFQFTVPTAVDANTDLLANWVNTTQAKAIAAQREGQATMKAQAAKGMVAYYQQEIKETQQKRADLARVGGGGNPYIEKQLAQYDDYLVQVKGKLAGVAGIWRNAQQKLKDLKLKDQAIIFKAEIKDVRTKIASVKSQLKAVSKQPHTVAMILKTQALKERLAALRAGLGDITSRSYQVRLTLRINTLEQNIALAKRRLEALRGSGGEHPQYSPQVSADITKLERYVKSAQGKVDALKQKQKPPVSIDTAPAFTAIGQIQQRIDAMHGKTIAITVNKGPAAGTDGRGGITGHSGGRFRGPHSGYPMTLHGDELVLPLDHPNLIPGLMRQAGLTAAGHFGNARASRVATVRGPAPPPAQAASRNEVHHHYYSSVSIPGGVIVDQPQKLADRLSPYQAANMRTAQRRRQRGQVGR